MKENIEKTEPQTGKKDHFYGDRSVVLSQKQLEIVPNNPLISDLYITGMGFYPNVKNHYRKRKKGISQNIHFLLEKVWKILSNLNGQQMKSSKNL